MFRASAKQRCLIAQYQSTIHELDAQLFFNTVFHTKSYSLIPVLNVILIHLVATIMFMSKAKMLNDLLLFTGYFLHYNK